jgi:hypothetical protein
MFATGIGYRLYDKTATASVLFFLLGLFYLIPPATAQSNVFTNDFTSVFEIRDIAVDATASSAAKARDNALETGQVTAFNTLLRRLTLREHHNRLPIPDADTISTYIRDFSVSDEKTSSVRYLSNLHVRFKAADIRLLLNEFGVPFAETISTPTVVIPILERSGTLSLWEDSNIWRKIWHQLSGLNGLVPLVHPKGDLTDKTSIGAQHAIDGNEARLQTIAKRYNAGAALVVHALLRQATATDGSRTLDIFITRYGAGSNALTQTMTITAPASDPVAQLLARGVGDVGRFIEERWKQDNLMNYGESGVLAVSVPFKNLKEWLGLQKLIENIVTIERVDVVLLSRDEARLNLHYLGNPDQLEVALEQTNLQLTLRGGVWYITTAQ